MLKQLYAEADGAEVDLSRLNEFFSPEQMSRIHAMYRKRRALTVNDINTLCEMCTVLKQEKKKTTERNAQDMSVDELEAYLKSRRSAQEK